MSGRKKLFWSLLFLVLAALSIWAVLSQSRKWSLAGLIESLRQANPLWLAAAILFTVLFVVLEAVALSVLLKGIGYRQPFSHTLLYSTSDIYFSAITPSATGGQPASAYFMVRDGVPAGAATVTLLVNLILYTLSLIILGLGSVIFFPGLFLGLRTLSKVLIAVGFAIQVGLIVLFFVLLGKAPTVFGLLRRFVRFLHRKKLIRRLNHRMKKLDAAQTEYETCARIMKGKTAVFLKALGWNLLQRALQLAVPMCIYLALGGELRHAGLLFASQCLVVLGYAPVPIPGAMGVADYLMVDAFSCLSFIAVEDAFALDMLSRGLSFYLCVAASGIVTLLGYALTHKKEKGKIKT